MNKNRDAFGQDLLRQYAHPQETIFEIVERDDGNFDAMPAAHYLTKFEDWSKKEKAGIRLAKGRVLDIGCGAGRHALYLQNKGLEVTGIDNSPGAIKLCRLRGLKKARLLPIEGVGKFSANSFDSVIMMFNNFGLFGGPAKAGQLLKQLYSITSPHGQIIAETTDPYKTKEPVHLAYHKFNRKRGRLGGQIRLRIRYKNLIGPWLDYWLISPQELKGLLIGTGWKVKKLMFQGSGYTMVLAK